MLLAAPAPAPAAPKRQEPAPTARDPQPAATPATPGLTEAETRSLRFLTPELLETPIDPDTYVLGPQDVLAVMMLIGEMRHEQLPVLPRAWCWSRTSAACRPPDAP
jgi:hypothetical protein